MREILIGLSLLFLIPSVIFMWIQFVYWEKTKQLIFKEDKSGVFGYCKYKRKR